MLALSLLAPCIESASASEQGLLANYNFKAASKRTRLPKFLREVSGLTSASDQHLLLHHDNNALVWRFDEASGTLQEKQLQAEPIKGDFEGIARVGDTIYLSTSHATLLRVKESPEQRLSLPQWSDLPFKSLCNFEGLGALEKTSGETVLLLPCKYPRFAEAGKPAAKDHLLYVFRHSLAPNESELAPLEIDVTKILRDFRLPRLRPSAIEVIDDRLLILAGKERVLLETTLNGDLIDWRRLRWPRHRQAEGLTLLANGTLVIADEGRWLGGTVTRYKRKSR